MSCFSDFTKSPHYILIESDDFIGSNIGLKFGSTRHTVLKTRKVFTFFNKFPGKHIVKIYNQKILKIGRSDRKSEFRRNGSKIGKTPPKSEE